MFAISATSNSSAQNYSLIKETIKEFIDKYGVDKIQYSIFVYGDSVIRVVNFNRTFPPSANELKAAIDAQTPLDEGLAMMDHAPLNAGPVLLDALQETTLIFNETESRQNAQKVLVVITDQNSGSDENDLVMAVRPLEDSGILVISVAVGAVNRSELLVISPNPLDVISVNDNENPLALAVRIMDRILRKASFTINQINQYHSFLLTF